MKENNNQAVCSESLNKTNHSSKKRIIDMTIDMIIIPDDITNLESDIEEITKKVINTLNTVSNK